MMRIYDGEFSAIRNWQWNQYFFRGESPLCSSSCSSPHPAVYRVTPAPAHNPTVIHGVAEKYTFTVSHRFGQLSIAYQEEFKLVINKKGRTLETSVRPGAVPFVLVGFAVYRQTRTGEIQLPELEVQELLPPSYNRINYALLESDLEPGMILL